jgi:hypothetical protein
VGLRTLLAGVFCLGRVRAIRRASAGRDYLTVRLISVF